MNHNRRREIISNVWRYIQVLASKRRSVYQKGYLELHPFRFRVFFFLFASCFCFPPSFPISVSLILAYMLANLAMFCLHRFLYPDCICLKKWRPIRWVHQVECHHPWDTRQSFCDPNCFVYLGRKVASEHDSPIPSNRTPSVMGERKI